MEFKCPYCLHKLQAIVKKTASDSMRNKPTRSKTGYRGVSFDGDKFKANIKINGKMKYLGYFNTPQEASKVYEAALADLRAKQ